MPPTSFSRVANMFDAKEKVARSKIHPHTVSYTRKNYELLKVVENRIDECCAAHIVQCCQQY